jgi:hypothetical protein
MLAEIRIDYQCKVNRSGYELFFQSENGEPWIKPKKIDAPETVRPFNRETFSRFFKISEDPKNEAVLTLDFVNAYGVLESGDYHRLQNISAWSTYLKIKDKQRASGEVKTIEHLKFLNLNSGFSFEIWEDGKVLPTYKPTSLGQALYFGWVFGWTTPELKECKYHKRYGFRKGCESFFSSTRNDAEFCANKGRCRAAYHQKQKGENKS